MTQGFYGFTRQEEYDVFVECLNFFEKIFPGKHFSGDGLITFMRIMSFVRDPIFQRAFDRAFDRNADSENEGFQLWRLNTLTWAATTVRDLPGDFVECGVFRGFMSAFVAEYLDFANIDKTFYLYDSFSGLSEEYSSTAEVENVQSVYDAAIKSGYNVESVRERFARWDNVKVVAGVVPDILHETAPEEIAYLHIDLNAAKAEIAALEVLFDRVTPGGLIILDDYGHLPHQEQHFAEQKWMKDRGYAILELPSGQGLVVKR